MKINMKGKVKLCGPVGRIVLLCCLFCFLTLLILKLLLDSSGEDWKVSEQTEKRLNYDIIDYGSSYPAYFEEGDFHPKEFDGELVLPVLNLESSTFFLETSGTGNMSLRQLLGVESAARNLRDLRHLHVYLLTRDAFINGNAAMFAKTSIMLSLEARYGGLQFHFVSFEKALEKTYLQDWYKSEVWKQSDHIPDHLSDGIRFAFLYKYGGLYLDFDIIFQEWISFEYDTLFWDTDYSVANAIMAFEKGHSFSKAFLEEFVKTYNPKGWTTNGSDIMTKLYKNCESSVACNIVAYSKEDINPVDWKNLTHYLDESNSQEVMKKVRESPIVHYCNSLLKHSTVMWNSTCALAVIAKTNCPVVWTEIEKVGWF